MFRRIRANPAPRPADLKKINHKAAKKKQKTAAVHRPSEPSVTRTGSGTALALANAKTASKNGTENNAVKQLKTHPNGISVLKDRTSSSSIGSSVARKKTISSSSGSDEKRDFRLISRLTDLLTLADRTDQLDAKGYKKKPPTKLRRSETTPNGIVQQLARDSTRATIAVVDANKLGKEWRRRARIADHVTGDDNNVHQLNMAVGRVMGPAVTIGKPCGRIGPLKPKHALALQRSWVGVFGAALTKIMFGIPIQVHMKRNRTQLIVTTVRIFTQYANKYATVDAAMGVHKSMTENPTNPSMDSIFDHAKFLISFFDDIITNIDRSSVFVEPIENFGRKHAYLHDRCGLRDFVWEKLFLSSAETFLREFGIIRTTKDAQEAWRLLMAVISDHICNGFQQEVKMRRRVRLQKRLSLTDDTRVWSGPPAPKSSISPPPSVSGCTNDMPSTARSTTWTTSNQASLESNDLLIGCSGSTTSRSLLPYSLPNDSITKCGPSRTSRSTQTDMSMQNWCCPSCPCTARNTEERDILWSAKWVLGHDEDKQHPQRRRDSYTQPLISYRSINNADSSWSQYRASISSTYSLMPRSKTMCVDRLPGGESCDW